MTLEVAYKKVRLAGKHYSWLHLTDLIFLGGGSLAPTTVLQGRYLLFTGQVDLLHEC